jgi:UDP-hydrolysing UDP-N-acetyl-D-glucosamine 2-epimerase
MVGLYVMEKDGFKPDAVTYSLIEGEVPQTMAKSVGAALMELPGIFDRLKPDIVLTNADRFETIATAVAASYMNIPVAHTLGGEVTGTIDEHVRHAVTKFSHLHFVAHRRARDRVIQMGENQESVFITGNPNLDIIKQMDFTVDPNSFLKKQGQHYGGVGGNVDFSKPYLLVVQHPVTTEYEAGEKQVLQTMDAVRATGLPALILWPNPDAGSAGISAGLRRFRERYNPQNMHFLRNLGVEDYTRVLHHASCVVGNSSSGIMEAGFLGVPSVNIGTRQGGRERTRNVIDVGYHAEGIKKAIEQQVARGRYEADYLFGDGNAGPRIADILATVEVTAQKRFNDILNINQ